MPVTVFYEEGSNVKALTLDIENEETYVWDSQAATHPVEGGTIVTDHIILANPKLTISGYISNKPLPSNYTSAGAVAEGYEKDETAAGDWRTETIENQEPIFSKVSQKLDVPDSKLQYNASSLIGAVVDAIKGNTPTAEIRKQTGQTTKKYDVTVWKLNTPDKNRIQAALEVLVRLQIAKATVHVVSDLTSLVDCIIQNISLPRTAEDGEGSTFTITFEQIKYVYSAEADALAATVNSLVQTKKSAGSKAAVNDAKKKGLISLASDRTGYGAGGENYSENPVPMSPLFQ